MKRVAVFASGRGSNLVALLAAQSIYRSYQIVLVVSNILTSGAIELARAAQVEAIVIPSRGRPRDEHERLLLQALLERDVDCLCLAGYMRILGPDFIGGFAGPILNVHPSLLPAFPGMHAQKQAVEAGVRWSGATIHFVDTGVDSGPVVLQEPIGVEDSDTEESLAVRILALEHALYPKALDIVARRAYDLRGRRVHLTG